MAIGHIDLDRIKANKEQKKEDLKEKIDKEKQINFSNAVSKLYSKKEQIDNSKNVVR
jgi:hypothetical protein